MPETINTRLASAALVLAWIAAAIAVEALRPRSVLDWALTLAMAAWAYLIHEPAPAPQVAWRQVFGLPILMGVLGVVALLIAHSDNTSLMFVVLTWLAAGALKDLIGDQRIYVRLGGPKS